MSIRQLVELVEPPSRREVSDHRWDVVEGDLSVRLPNDYKELVETYGPGVFGGFLHIYQPNAPWVQLDLKQQSDAELEALRELKEDGEEIPYLLDGLAELISFGRSENGDAIFWHCADRSAPENWTVVVKEARGEEWFAFDGGATDFLFSVLARDVRVSIFPSDFPAQRVGFAPYETW
jgi:hypothetical protein